jgi:hypothetical protein
MELGMAEWDNVITISSEKREYIILAVRDNGRELAAISMRWKSCLACIKHFSINEDARGIGLFLTRNQLEAIGGKLNKVSR